MFEGIDGTGVFLGVGEAAVPEDAGDGLDVGSVAQQVRSATVTGAVPGDVFLDAGASHPVAQGFQTHGMRRQWEDDLIAVAILGLTDKVQKSVVERYDYSTGRTMSFGLALLKLQQFVRVVDIGIGEVFDIAPPKSAVQTKDERTTNVGVLLVIVRSNERGYFFLTENILFQLSVVFLYRNTGARILTNDILFYGSQYHFLESGIKGMGTFSCETLNQILGERAHQVLGQLLGLYF